MPEPVSVCITPASYPDSLRFALEEGTKDTFNVKGNGIVQDPRFRDLVEKIQEARHKTGLTRRQLAVRALNSPTFSEDYRKSMSGRINGIAIGTLVVGVAAGGAAGAAAGLPLGPAGIVAGGALGAGAGGVACYFAGKIAATWAYVHFVQRSDTFHRYLKGLKNNATFEAFVRFASDQIISDDYFSAIARIPMLDPIELPRTRVKSSANPSANPSADLPPLFDRQEIIMWVMGASREELLKMVERGFSPAGDAPDYRPEAANEITAYMDDGEMQAIKEDICEELKCLPVVHSARLGLLKEVERILENQEVPDDLRPIFQALQTALNEQIRASGAEPKPIPVANLENQAEGPTEEQTRKCREVMDTSAWG